MARKSSTPTMSDVAARAGVSRALVSLVFRDQPGASDATRALVRRVAAEIGYAPDQRARLLSRRRSGLIGVTFGLRHDFHGRLVEALYPVVPAGFELNVNGFAAGHPEADAVEALLAYRCEALIMIGSELPVAALARLAGQLPVVVVARRLGRPGRVPGLSVVRTDDVAGAHLAVEHLIARGHRRIGYAGADGLPGDAERRRGVARAFRRAGLGTEPVWLPGGLTEEEGIRAAADLIARRRARRVVPTAVLAFNDRCAMGVQATLVQAGLRVPDDLALVGYDDIPGAALPWVGLTTVRQDLSALATGALGSATALIRAESGPEPGAPSGFVGTTRGTGGESTRPAEVTVPPSLVLRSTA